MAWKTEANKSVRADKHTAELKEEHPELAADIEARENAATPIAIDLMAKIDEAGLTTYHNVEGKGQMPDRAAVRVDLAKDGETLFTKLVIDINKVKLIANLSTDGKEITSIQAEQYNYANKKSDVYKGADEISKSPFDDSVKKIAAFIEESGLVAEKGGISSLEQFTRDSNKLFKETRPLKPFIDKETGEPVVNEKTGEPVELADTHIKYDGANGKGYERAYLRSDALPNISMEFGVQPDGKAYIKAVNEALCADGETPRDPNAKYAEVPPATCYINNKDALNELTVPVTEGGVTKDVSITDIVPELGEVVERYKANEQGKEQKKAKKQDDYER